MPAIRMRSALATALLLFTGCSLHRPPAADDAQWIEKTLHSLTLRQKAGQLLFPRITGAYMPLDGVEYEQVRQWIVKDGIGGVIVTIAPPLELAAKLNALQQLAAVPLLVTADMESGPGQTLSAGTILPYGIDNGGATRFPPLMALGATGDENLAYRMGRITALEGRAVGVHITFAPVVDVNNNPDNPIINTRSYGADPQLVARLASAHIRGLQEHGMLATAKHFPGHGDTRTDSHLGISVIAADRARVDSVELLPYRAAIADRVAGVMTAHLAFPALTGDSVPATLSSAILTDLLRRELQFEGVVFTDAIDMGALVNTYGRVGAAVKALQAGADVLLQPYPQDVAAIIDSVVAGVRSGVLSEAALDARVRRVLELKARLRLHRANQVALAAIPEIVAQRAHLEVASTAAERAITLAADAQQLLPLRGRVLSVVYSDDQDPFAGAVLNRALRPQLPGLRTLFVDANAGAEQVRRIVSTADSSDVVLFSAFIRVVDHKGELAMAHGVAETINRLAQSKAVVVVAFGNPYLRSQLPDIRTYMLAWGQSDVVQRAAAGALMGQTAITGRLPIAIPPYYRIGHGIQLPAR